MSQVVTFRLNLNMGGGQGVTAALAAMRQQFQQATTSLTAFRNLLNAGPGTRLAQQQLGMNALQAELRAAEARAGARAMATPGGQKSLARTARAEAVTGLAGAQQAAAVQQARAQFAESTSGRQTAVARAAVEAETDLAEARQRNARQAAQTAHAESASGRQTAATRAALDVEAGLGTARQQTAAQQARAQVMASPVGQQSLQQTAAVQGQGSLAQMRQQLAAGKAQAAYETSPAGQKAGAEMRKLRTEREAQEESRRRRQVIGEYGQLGGRMKLFREDLGKVVGVAAATVPALYALGGIAVDTAAGLAAHASPTGARHLAASEEAVRIEAGRPFQDAQRQQAAYFQRMAEEAQRDLNPGALRSFARGWATQEGVFGGRWLHRLDLATTPDSWRNQAQLTREREIMAQGQQYMGPSPARYIAPEDFREQAQIRAQNVTALEAQNMQRQYENFFASPGVTAQEGMEEHLRAMRGSLDALNANAGRFYTPW